MNAFADGRLEPARAAALAQSLTSDPLARARIDGWKRQNEGLRTLFASVLFEPVPVRLLPTMLPSSRPAPSPAPIAARRRPAGRSSTGLALTTTAIGVALIGFMAGALATIATNGFGRSAWGSSGGETRTAPDPSPLAGRAAEAYRAALADPAHGDLPAGDEARLQRWMARQLSGSARIPDLRPQGWKLLGGRVVPGRYAPAAFLTYGQGADRLGIYVAREPVPAAIATTTSPDGGIVVTAWSADGLGTALTSTREIRAPEGIAEPVADAVRRQMSGDDPTP